jgi:hypothetical protein
LTGVVTVGVEQWPENAPFMSGFGLESPVAVRALLDERGRLGLARLRRGYGPGQRGAEIDRVRREAGYEGPDVAVPDGALVSGHDEVVIALGEFGATWAVEPFDPDDPRREREP